MPRFVVLQHEMPPGARSTHWDFMLEHEGVLRTWALAEPPAIGREIAAEALADHRLAYLEYQGPVSGNRGTVTRWDAGNYETLADAPDESTIHLSGAKFIGTAHLRRDSSAPQRWIFCFSASESAADSRAAPSRRASDGLEADPR